MEQEAKAPESPEVVAVPVDGDETVRRVLEALVRVVDPRGPDLAIDPDAPVAPDQNARHGLDPRHIELAIAHPRQERRIGDAVGEGHAAQIAKLLGPHPHEGLDPGVLKGELSVGPRGLALGEVDPVPQIEGPILQLEPPLALVDGVERDARIPAVLAQHLAVIAQGAALDRDGRCAVRLDDAHDDARIDDGIACGQLVEQLIGIAVVPDLDGRERHHHNAVGNGMTDLGEVSRGLEARPLPALVESLAALCPLCRSHCLRMGRKASSQHGGDQPDHRNDACKHCSPLFASAHGSGAVGRMSELHG